MCTVAGACVLAAEGLLRLRYASSDYTQLSRPCPDVVSQYSDAQLYNQLRYYISLFDIKKAHELASGPVKSGTCAASYCNLEDVSPSLCVDLQPLMLRYEPMCEHLTSIVEKYLDQSGRRWVQMSTLFSFMKL